MKELMIIGKIFGKAAKIIYNLQDEDTKIFGTEKEDRSVLTFKECYSWALRKKELYPETRNLFVSVKKNPDSVTDRDKLKIITAVLDDKSEVITRDGIKGISEVYIVRSIDLELVNALDGKETTIIEL